MKTTGFICDICKTPESDDRAEGATAIGFLVERHHIRRCKASMSDHHICRYCLRTFAAIAVEVEQLRGPIDPPAAEQDD